MPSSDASASISSEAHFDQPVIAEATSSADVSSIMISKSSEHDYSTEDDYANEIASNVELSNDEVPTRWFHPQEHDYPKNEIEPEPSGMDEQFEVFESEIEECSAEPVNEPLFHKSVATSKAMLNVGNCQRINNYDTELPQEIFHKPENVQGSFQTSSASVLVNNFMHHQDSTPVVVRQVIEPAAPRYNTTVIVKDEQSEANSYHNDNYMIEEAEIDGTRSYRGDEIHVNVAKNVKLLAFPSNVKYNEKYIIEEVSFIDFFQLLILILLLSVTAASSPSATPRPPISTKLSNERNRKHSTIIVFRWRHKLCLHFKDWK